MGSVTATSKYLAECRRIVDHFYMLACVLVCYLAIACHNLRFAGNVFKCMTLMSGGSDTNAELCLFLRMLYTLHPSDLAYDKQEVTLGKRFLSAHYRFTYWLVRLFGLRVLMPGIRSFYVSYLGRALGTQAFIRNSIEKRNVDQVIILGAGFDTTAYRTRAMRIIRDPASDQYTRYVRVYEVDLPEVQRRKVEVLKKTMGTKEWAYYTEGVTYLQCRFGVQSLQECLREGGVNADLPTAILWEGVTYYLTLDAIEDTLSRLSSYFRQDCQVKAAGRALREGSGGGCADATEESRQGEAAESEPYQAAYEAAYEAAHEAAHEGAHEGAQEPAGCGDEAPIHADAGAAPRPAEVAYGREAKSGGGREAKSAGGREAKSGGGREAKSGGGREAKSGGGREAKSDGPLAEGESSTASLDGDSTGRNTQCGEDLQTGAGSSSGSCAKRSKRVYLMLDYMPSQTINSGEWIWRLVMELSKTLGSPFLTGLDGVDKLLNKFHFHVSGEILRKDVETLMARYDAFSVFFETNSTNLSQEPQLVVVEAYLAM